MRMGFLFVVLRINKYNDINKCFYLLLVIFKVNTKLIETYLFEEKNQMVLIDENKLKGNYGEYLVMQRLSRHCLVRPVASGTDIGIDIYCESVDKNQPFLHFWIQVKTGSKHQIKDGFTSCSFDKKHLEYWIKQPVPVFAAIVPLTWPPEIDVDIYIINLTKYLIENDINKKNKQVRIKSDYVWKHNDKDSIEDFLKEVVPTTTAFLDLKKGILSEIPSSIQQYTRKIPNTPVIKFWNEIENRIRITAAMSIINESVNKEFYSTNADFIKKMASIIKVFKDDEHQENFYALGKYYHLEKDFKTAIEYYQRALKSIDDDPKNIIQEERWKKEYAKISDNLKLAVNSTQLS